MSRAYRINVSQTIRRHVQIDDGICAPLELLQVLPVDRMQALLARELKKRGFTLEGKKARREEGDGIVIEIDLEAGEIALRVEQDEEVKVTSSASAIPDRKKKDLGRSKLKEQADKQATEKAKQIQERLRRKATERLEGKLQDLRGEIDDAINRVTAEALKERARKLGEIEEMKEDPETGSLTIKVRL